MPMDPENVDRAITEAIELLKEVRGEDLGEDVLQAIEAIRAYAKGEGPAEDGAVLAYRLGSTGLHDSLHAIRILLSLINVRAPTSDPEKKAARRYAFPSMWDYLSD